MNTEACSANTASLHIPKHMGRIHWENAPRHNIYISTCKWQIRHSFTAWHSNKSQFYTRSTFSVSPHLFGSLLLDLYQHTAKCAMKHMSVSASRAKASKLANTPLEDNAISLHLAPSKQHPSKQLFILILSFFPFPFRPLSRLVLYSGMQMKNSSSPHTGSNVTLKFFQPPLPAFCSRLARELSRTTFLTNAQ